MSVPGDFAVVAVRPAAVLVEHERLFAALELALAVAFVGCDEVDPRARPCDGLVAVTTGDRPVPAPAPAGGGLPTIVFAGPRAPTGVAEEARLGDRDGVDRRLRGVALSTVPAGAPVSPVAVRDALAVGPSGPSWTRSPGPGPVDRVRARLPVLDDDEVLRDALRDGRALALVALVSFLRGLAPDPWPAPRPRAAFVFDDPNLHRRTYGHIDFARLGEHAAERGYHAAMAMVPLDGRRAHPGAVRTFRALPDRLSLVMHGNDHTRSELMRPRDERAALTLGAQALHRIARFERAHGVGVDRVMMPPHGLCSRVVARTLGRLGYDALCAIHPCPWSGHPRSAPLLAGWTPAEFVDGCTVLPRFPLDAGAAEIALRAFLGQPLVLYGHHGDLADGFEPLARAAERVNRLGDVGWCSLGEIARGNHQLRVDGDVASLRPWATRMLVTLPAGAAALEVLPPPGGIAGGVTGWTIAHEDAAPVPFGTARPVGARRQVLVQLGGDDRADPRLVADPRPRVWPLLRRRLTEGRDRLAPHLRRLRRDPVLESA